MQAPIAHTLTAAAALLGGGLWLTLDLAPTPDWLYIAGTSLVAALLAPFPIAFTLFVLLRKKPGNRLVYVEFFLVNACVWVLYFCVYTAISYYVPRTTSTVDIVTPRVQRYLGTASLVMSGWGTVGAGSTVVHSEWVRALMLTQTLQLFLLNIVCLIKIFTWIQQGATAKPKRRGLAEAFD